MKAHHSMIVCFMMAAMFYFGFEIGRSEKYEAQVSKVIDDATELLKRVQFKELRWQNTISDI